LSQVLSLPEASLEVLRPLCVDLDGTLVKSDTLVDSLLALMRSRPGTVFALPLHALRGKARFKRFVTENVSLDVAHLPYNREVLRFLHSEHAQGRPIYLATGADTRLAERVATHLGLFAGVLGSNGAVNLTGNRKLEGLKSRLGGQPFDYIGNDVPDLPLLACAFERMVANPSLRLRMRMRMRGIMPARSFVDREKPLISFIRALRIHQWSKNLLVFLPLLLAHHVPLNLFLSGLLAFSCFSIAASSAYIVNDMLDIEADRLHAQKRARPFASGDLSPVTGSCIAFLFFVLAVAGARLLPIAFFEWLLLYLVTTVAYTWSLKRIALVDVLVLSGLYVLRLLAGSAATQSHISHWLAGFSAFLFFSLAIVKRFAELQNLQTRGLQPKNGRGYLIADIEQLRSFGTASAFAAVMVFAIYISGSDVTLLYRQPKLLWLIMPFMLLWLCRVWLLASRGELDEDPLVFALSDRASLAIGAAVAIIAVLAI
jgi:4-hydroxybenzoate polyprenyltransferase